MSKNVLVLTGSPRKNGNSRLLAVDIYEKGAIAGTDYLRQAEQLEKNI